MERRVSNCATKKNQNIRRYLSNKIALFVYFLIIQLCILNAFVSNYSNKYLNTFQNCSLQNFYHCIMISKRKINASLITTTRKLVSTMFFKFVHIYNKVSQ